MSLRALTLLFLLAASPGHAGTIELVPTCVAIDERDDALTSLERAQASTMMTHVLEQQDLLVVETGCVDTYTLSHERDGEQLIVHVRGPHGSRRLHVAGFAALPDAYRRMVHSLREPVPAPVGEPVPAPVGEPSDPYTDATAPTTAMAPAPAAAVLDVAEPAVATGGPEEAEPTIAPRPRNVLYAQLGVGTMAGADSPRSFSGGFRREVAATIIDGSVTGFGSDSAGTQMVSGSRLAGKLLRELTPDRASSVYLGGGLGLAGSTIKTQDLHTYSGSGLEAIASAGADIRRDQRGLRLFVQADLIVPLYTLTLDTVGITKWTPSVMFSFGIGLGL